MSRPPLRLDGLDGLSATELKTVISVATNLAYLKQCPSLFTSYQCSLDKEHSSQHLAHVSDWANGSLIEGAVTWELESRYDVTGTPIKRG